MPKLYLLDGHSLAYRAYFAIPATMRNKDGLPTNAIYGFTSLLLNIILNEKPDYIAVAFDLKAPTFRHALYSQYKGHRPPADPELVVQLPYLLDMVDAFSIPHFSVAGFEADDLLGTLAKQAEAVGIDTVIVTGDMDALQLVTPHIQVMATVKGVSETVMYDAEKVVSRYGLRPDQIVDLKSLKGDASDNIPGVAGIGEKTAVKLLSEFNTLENILSHLDSITPSGLRDKLKNDHENARLSYQLAKINTSAPVHPDFKQLILNISWDKLKQKLLDHQFTTLAAKLPAAEQPAPVKKIVGNYQTVKAPDALATLKNTLLQSPEFAFDIETTSLTSVDTNIVGISFCIQEGKAFYIPYPLNEIIPDSHEQQELFSAPVIVQEEGLPFREIDLFLREVMGTPSLKIGQNIKFDINVLKSHGIAVQGPFFDTMIADYLLDPLRSRHNLKFLAQYYFNLEMTTIDQLIGNGKQQLTMDKVPVEQASLYCCADADMTFRLKDLLVKKLIESGLYNYYMGFEVPLISVLSDMECLGIKLNVAYLNILAKELSGLISEQKKNIYLLAGCEFNLNSPMQTAEILFRKLGLPSSKKTKSGMSTDNDVLEALAPHYEIAEKFIQYRQLTKLKNTYVAVLPMLVNAKTGNIHSTFNQSITSTGRLSSTNPNLQNIPIKTEIGSKIRKAFIPTNNENVLLSADYSQMELRILAFMSGDELLCNAFSKGEDVHTTTASVLFEVAHSDVTPEMRRRAKTINFGIIYGMGPKGLGDALNISMHEASEFITNYFRKYPAIKNFIDKTISDTLETGFIKTFFGRIRPVPELKESAGKGKNAGKRIAVNSIIQGTAADIVKIKMIEIAKLLPGLPYRAKMLLQVHDELVFEVDRHFINDFAILIQSKMETIQGIPIKIPVTLSWGDNWQEAK